MTRGTIRDIRTGLAIASTQNLTASFVNYVLELIATQVPFYMVHGPCRHLEVRACVEEFIDMEIGMLYDRRMPADMILIFEGAIEDWEEIA